MSQQTDVGNNTAAGLPPAKIRFLLSVDLDHRTLKGSIGLEGLTLRQVLARILGAGPDGEIPPDRFPLPLDLIPNVGVQEVSIQNLPGDGTRAGGVRLEARCGVGNESAVRIWVNSYLQTKGNRRFGTDLEMGLRFVPPLTLKATPVIGPLLQEVGLQNLQLTYGTAKAEAKPKAKASGPGATPPAKEVRLSISLAAGPDAQTTISVPIRLPRKRKDGPVMAAALPTGPMVEWIPVGQAFGPFYLDQIGLVFGLDANREPILGLALSASLNVQVLGLSLKGLSVALPLKALEKPAPKVITSLQLDLEGISFWLNANSVFLAGGLLKRVDQGVTDYIGGVILQVQKFGLTGFGAFANKDGNPSLFLFAMVTAPIGGPPWFQVTGLAAGFGYNRALILPAYHEIQDFALVQGARSPAAFDGNPMEKALNGLGRHIPPRTGAYWLAAGIQFTAVQVVKAFALLTASFGNDFEIGLLGIGAAELPQGKPYVYAELALKAHIHPSAGVLGLSGVLTPSSYVLHSSCRLTGGFALYLWFDGPNAGDFVLSLGGYHPNFSVPEHYPSLGRLGIAWRVSDVVTIQGGAYFALVPSATMAGGNLEVSFHAGDLRAWFTAHADFVAEWCPFRFDIWVGASIGVSYTWTAVVTKTFTAELSADVHIWGPRTQGSAVIRWWVCSFTVAFGGDPNSHDPRAAKTVDWNTMYSSMLPQSAKDGQQICRALVQGGLLRETDLTDGTRLWAVRADTFTFATQTAIPARQVQYGDEQLLFDQDRPVGARPMGAPDLGSRHQVTVDRLDASGNNPRRLPLGAWAWEPNRSDVPAALWGPVRAHENAPPDSRNDKLPQRILGLRFAPAASPPQHPVTVSIKALAGDPLPDRTVAAVQAAPPVPPLPEDPKPIAEIKGTVMHPDVVARRSEVAALLQKAGLDVEDKPLPKLAAMETNPFLAAPRLGPLGSTGKSRIKAMAAEADPQPSSIANVSRAAETAAAPSPVKLRAVLRQYQRFHASDQVPSALMAVTSANGASLGPLANRADRLLAQAVLGENGPRLHPGLTLIYDVDASAQPLNLQGLDALRVVVFDSHNALLADVVLGEQPEGRYQLPPSAARVALTCLSRPERGPITGGWRGISSLLQITPQSFQGDRVVVLTQSPHYASRNRMALAHGPVTAADVVSANWVSTAGGKYRGWLETTLPGHTRSFTVVVRTADGTSANEADANPVVTVPLLTAAGDEQHGAYMPLTPVFAYPAGPEVHLFYRMPEADQETLRIIVETAPDWQLDGVVGYDHPDGPPLRGEAGAELPPGATTDQKTYQQKVEVTFP